MTDLGWIAAVVAFVVLVALSVTMLVRLIALVVATLAARFAPRLAEGYTPRPEFLVLSRPSQGAPMLVRRREA